MLSSWRVLLVVGLLMPAIVRANSLDRDRDPVVLTGSDLPTLLGLALNQVVAFRYDNGWQQIPVQIDERKVVDYRSVYNGVVPAGLTTLAYADPNTYCGSDTDASFDSDDELVFMAKDAGDLAGPGAGEPSGVIAGSGVEITVTDPLDSGVGYVYLFRNDGTLNPDAGQDYVTYVFNLLAGPYIPNYNTADGPNPEDSEAYSAYYRTHFADRWIRDETNVYAGGATGVDILDRHKNLFVIGSCGRTEDSFSNGEGAFFVNKDGPVRAIRSYMGANSGPVTQRDHYFYEQRQEILTHLRVHGIPGIMDLYDYSPAATGMTYYNDLNAGGVTIDGVPDSVTLGQTTWEMVTGTQGTVVITAQIVTDASLYFASYYSDDSTPSNTQCTGDAYEYGLSGLWIPVPIPNTDPYYPPYYILAATRILNYEPPGQPIALAELRRDQTATPLTIGVQAYQATHTLTVTVINPAWGDVDLDPDPDDPNLPAYPPATVVTLTAQPSMGKSFTQWRLFDPNFPGDANHATVDTNTILQLTLDTNMEVEAGFKCGSSGMAPFIGLALLLAVTSATRRWA